MSDIKNKYGTTAQAIAVGADGLATSAGGVAGRSSAVVDNTTNLFEDALVSGVVRTVAGTVAANKCCYVYAYGTSDTGTPKYTDGISGSVGAFTRTDPANLRLLSVVSVPAADTDYIFGPVSVARAFGGILPPKWGIFVANDTNIDLKGTATQDVVNFFWYQGVLRQTV